MKTFVLAVLVTAFAGCAGMPTEKGFQQAMDGHIGANVGQMIADLGPPQSEYLLPDGSKVLQFKQARTVQVGGFPTTTAVTADTRGTVSNGTGFGNFTANTTTYVPTRTPMQDIAMHCTINVTVDPKSVVTAWKAQGNHCVAPQQ